MPRLRLAAFGFIFLALGVPGVGSAKPFVPPPMPAGYDDPGLKPTNPLGEIIARLVPNLTDPFSLRGFIICELSMSGPTKPFSKWGEWKPAVWSEMFAYYAKNAYGGYAGLQIETAIFRHGSIDLDPEVSGYSSELDAMNQKELATCQHIPDDQVQKLVQNAR